MLNEALNVVIAQSHETVGEVVMLKEVLADARRALVISQADEERVVRLAEPLLNQPLRPCDSLLLESRSGYVYERIPKAEVEELILEEVPDISYHDIGGLAGQIEQIRDAIELPYLHADLFKEHQLKPPKGVLLYGPPGCGKTREGARGERARVLRGTKSGGPSWGGEIRLLRGAPEQFLELACRALGCFGCGVCAAVVAGGGVVGCSDGVALHLAGGVFDLFRGGPGGGGVHGVVFSWVVGRRRGGRRSLQWVAANTSAPMSNRAAPPNTMKKAAAIPCAVLAGIWSCGSR